MLLNPARKFFFGDDGHQRLGRSEKAAYLLPIRLSIIYLLISVIVYVICPFEWITYKPVLFYGLLFFYAFAFWGGYRLGVRKPLRSSYVWTEKQTHTLAHILSVLVVANFFIYFLNIFRSYGISNLDFHKFFKTMLDGIQDPGYGYNMRYERSLVLSGKDVLGGYAFSVFNYLWAFVQYPTLIGSMLYFKDLKLYGKVFIVLNLALILVYYLSVGTTIDVFTVFLFIVLPTVLQTFYLWRKDLVRKKHIIKLISIIVIGFLIIGAYFMCMMLSRGGINSYNTPGFNVGNIKLNMEMLRHLPPNVAKFWVSFSSYLTQGYYAFSLALTQNWTPMFGLGSNMFVVDFISGHFYDIDQFTYQAKLEPFGWDSRVRWHSMYTWIANDLSLYGVVLYMLFIGFLFGMMFKDSITSKNPFAQISIFYFVLMVFFIPCNNQIGQRPETLFSFVFIIICWLVSRHPFPAARRVLDKMA